IDLRPDKAYSPASIAKAYMQAMNIELPRNKFANFDYEQGIAMQSYYGGRAEVRIRRTPVPVVLTDFTSQYSTVNTLLGNFDVLRAERITFEDCTAEIQELLDQLTLEQLFEKENWKRFKFFALLKPEDDIFPVRKVYNGRTQNIGVNRLTSEPLWFAGPDAIDSRLLSDKSPRVLKAIRIVAHGTQKGLGKTNLAGLVPIDSRVDDFFQ